MTRSPAPPHGPASDRAPLLFAALAPLLLATLALPACQVDPPDPPATDPAPEFPPANRPDVRGVEGAVSSGHPLATAAGHEILRGGGNAVDAVVAMAGVLAVVRPHMNGVGGDAYGLIFEAETGQVHALDGSGRAGRLATPDFFTGRELEEIPSRGAASVSMPGAVEAWIDALDHFGTRSPEELLEPAIRYARDGFPVTRTLRQDIEAGADALNEAARRIYLRDGEAPPVGSLLRNPALAGTLEAIAREGRSGFYEGAVAERLASFIEEQGGYLRADDFAGHTSTWREPLTLDHLGYRIHVMPPSTQGIAQLQQLALQESFDLPGLGHNSADYLHVMAEVRKLAFADRDRWIADPDFVSVPVDALLEPGYLRERAGGVDMHRAIEEPESGLGAERFAGNPDPGGGSRDGSGDTVVLMAVDRQGNAVTWIQSIYMSFGSGLMEPETGVVLHNRGALFSLDPEHPNVIEPGKRPYHTLTPLLATREDGAGFTLATPGGDGQTHILLQVMNNVLHFGMAPQEAIEAPRIRGQEGVLLSVEDRIPPEVRRELEARGHELEVIRGWSAVLGNAQMILVEPGTGTLTVGADARREAYGLAY